MEEVNRVAILREYTVRTCCFDREDLQCGDFCTANFSGRFVWTRVGAAVIRTRVSNTLVISISQFMPDFKVHLYVPGNFKVRGKVIHAPQPLRYSRQVLIADGAGACMKIAHRAAATFSNHACIPILQSRVIEKTFV